MEVLENELDGMIMYTAIRCPRCKKFEERLNNLGIKYNKVYEIKEMYEFAVKNNISELPIFRIGDLAYAHEVMDEKIKQLEDGAC